MSQTSTSRMPGRLTSTTLWMVSLAALFTATSGLAQQAEVAPRVATVVVPVVGAVTGPANTRWKTDLELRNDQPAEATVSLILAASPDQPAIILTIPPGESVSFSDVVGQAFGLDAALSPLIVQTLGRRSVSVGATAYGVREGEAFKLEPIAIHYGSTYFPVRVLPGLTFSAEYRTNIGLANLGERDAEFVLALQRIPGRNVAVTRAMLKPNTLWHFGLQSFFPMIRDGGDFTVVVECNSSETYVYGSVIENATNAATFIEPTVGLTTVEP